MYSDPIGGVSQVCPRISVFSIIGTAAKVMNDQFGTKMIDLCVAKLSNSRAITGVPRLDIDHFEFQLDSPRLMQRFLSLKIQSHQRLQV